jgi:hypothetical protein
MCLLLGASPERLFFAEWSLQAGESRLAVMRAAPVQTARVQVAQAVQQRRQSAVYYAAH